MGRVELIPGKYGDWFHVNDQQCRKWRGCNRVTKVLDRIEALACVFTQNPFAYELYLAAQSSVLFNLGNKSSDCYPSLHGLDVRVLV